ncbi:unnamed protein product, partial [Rotaria sp. Silwood2]
KTEASLMSVLPPTLKTDQNQISTSENGKTRKVAIPATSSSSSLVQSSSSETLNSDADIQEIYNYAKLIRDWPEVSSALTAHPEWLTRIPDNRQWAILHQIVYSGDVKHLDEALSLQATNSDFRLLCRGRDGKTVCEVAAERASIHPTMLQCIERLVAIDELLDNAKSRKWDLVKQFITLQPDIVNEKSPYRRYYLIHHLAYVGQLDVFKDLSKICHFRLDLLAGNKTIIQLAREHNKIAFAEHIESLRTKSNEITEDKSDQTISSQLTGIKYYSSDF